MSDSNFPDSYSDSERTLKDHVDVVLRRMWVVFAVLAISAMITIGYTYTRVPLYTSVATIEIEEKGSKARDKEGIYGNPEYDQYKGYLATQVEILKSRNLAEELVKRRNLIEDPEFAPQRAGGFGALSSWLYEWFSGETNPEGVSIPQSARLRSVAANVTSRVGVKTVKQSNLLQISMNGTNPQEAARLLQDYINIYLEQNLQKRRQESLQAAGWLKEELESVEKKLRTAQMVLLDFVVDNGIVDSKEGGLAQVINILNKRMEGHLRSEEARAKVQALEDQNVPDESFLLPKDVANNEYIGKLKQDLAMMESEYTQMRGLYSPNYPKLRLLEKKIKFLTERIGVMEKNLVSSALSSAKKEEKILESSYESGKREVARVRSLEAEYSNLKKDVETNTEFQKILLKEFKNMDIRARTITNDIKIVDRPSEPGAPSWPKKKMFLLVGIMIGLVVGVGGAFVLDRLDNTLQSSRDIDVDLSASCLGVVPDLDKLPSSDKLTVPGAGYELLAYTAPKSAISNAIRNIENSIFLANPSHDLKCVAVSSARATEGKTLISTSIAAVLALDKTKRVVLVDADLRRPRIHKVFGLQETGFGFSSVFNGKDPDFLKLVRAHAKVPGLFYVTSGPIPDDPALILKSDRARQVFAFLKESFDYIIIDCPPILGLPDTPNICRNADGLIIVARQGYVRRNEVKQAMNIMSAAKACTLLGVVMNMAYAPGASKYVYRYGGEHYQYSYYREYYSQNQKRG